VLAVTLPSVDERRRHAIDYLGALLLAAGLSSIILATTLGGTSYPWGSAQIVGLALLSVVLLVAFVVVEGRAAEPILPPALFSNRVFRVTSAVSLVVGFALFGALTYLPLFQQVVRGLSPTASGLQLLPVMGGLLVTSIVSGQIITRTGRYKLFPILGTAVAALGMWLLSSLDQTTSTGVAALHMLILGLGLGMVMQVLVLATQNAVPYDQLGVATSGATLFRSIGGSLGTAILGAIFANQLSKGLDQRLPGGHSGGTGALDPSALKRLTGPVHDAYISAFTHALHSVFVVATWVVVVAFVLTWLIPERPLRRTVETTGPGEVLGPPVDTDALREVTRALGRAVGRERTLAFLQDATQRAGVDLTPSASWLLLRAGAPDCRPLHELRALPHVVPESFDRARADLEARRLLDGDAGLTAEGHELRGRLVAARTHELRVLVADWDPEEHPELAPLLMRLAEELGDPPARAGEPVAA